MTQIILLTAAIKNKYQAQHTEIRNYQIYINNDNVVYFSFTQKHKNRNFYIPQLSAFLDAYQIDCKFSTIQLSDRHSIIKYTLCKQMRERNDETVTKLIK